MIFWYNKTKVEEYFFEFTKIMAEQNNDTPGAKVKGYLKWRLKIAIIAIVIMAVIWLISLIV